MPRISPLEFLCFHRLCCIGSIMFSHCPRPRPVVMMPVPVSVPCGPCHRYFFRFARILNGFRWNLRECNHYHQQIKRSHFGRNCSMDNGAGYDRRLESTSTSVAAMSSRCWRLVNKRTNFTVHILRQTRSRTLFQVNLKISLTNFI